MNIEIKTDLLEYIEKKCPNAKVVFMDPTSLIFEENTKINCFYCGKYGNNWKCPPNLPDINYPKMFSEFSEGMFVYVSYDIKDKKQYDEVRTESSVVLHKLLLSIEKWLLGHNRATALSFGAGSCKLCKGGCGKEKCNNPYMSRSPLEATGVNVVKSAALYDIKIVFPPDKELKRVGLVVWQNGEE